jgi:glycosyltransferase involved in cell wall biosynthesis
MSDRPLHIVQYLQRFRAEDGGVPRAVIDLSAVLHRRGHEVTVITQGTSSLPPEWVDGSADAPRVLQFGEDQTPPLLPTDLHRVPGQIREMRQRVKSFSEALASADILHLHGVWDQLEASLAKYARKKCTAHLITIHGMLDEWTVAQKRWKKAIFLALFGKSMLNGASAVHCTSKEEARQSERFWPRGRTLVLPLLTDLSEYQTLPGPELANETFGLGSAPTLVFLGRLHPIKRVEALLDAAASLRAQHPALRVILAGTGDTHYVRTLQRHAQSRGIADGALFAGQVSGAMKVSLLQRADVVVLPSRHENWGIALFEALAAGTPVVTTRSVNVWQEVESSGGAIALERVEELADVVGSLLRDDGRRRRMGAAGRAWVLRTLDTDSVAALYETEYRRLIREPQ